MECASDTYDIFWLNAMLTGYSLFFDDEEDMFIEEVYRNTRSSARSWLISQQDHSSYSQLMRELQEVDERVIYFIFYIMNTIAHLMENYISRLPKRGVFEQHDITIQL